MQIYITRPGGWPRSLKCSEVKLRPALLVPGWATTRVFSDESPPNIYVFLNQPLPPYEMLTAIVD